MPWHGLQPPQPAVVRQILVRSLHEVRVGLACVKLGMSDAGNTWRGFLATRCFGNCAPAAFIMGEVKRAKDGGVECGAVEGAARARGN